MEVNETKLARAVGASALRSAHADELEDRGIVSGYASPMGITGATVVVDDLVARSPNLVVGANRPGYHLLNTNVPRDYRPNIVTAVAAIRHPPLPRRGARPTRQRQQGVAHVRFRACGHADEHALTLELERDCDTIRSSG